MPTSRRVKEKMFSLIPADFGETIIDLGCGWGSLIFPLAKQHPRGQIVGCELSPAPWLFCWFRQLIGPYANIRLVRSDFFKVSCKEASVVICYLDPSPMKALEEKLARELRPDTLVIVNMFALPSWKPEAIYEVDGLHCTWIYLYRVPPARSETVNSPA